MRAIKCLHTVVLIRSTDLGIVKQFMNDALEQCNSMFAEINDMF
jgi:hypothetical protein